jgi:ParB-like chromosome segregation protein Spo0J
MTIQSIPLDKLLPHPGNTNVMSRANFNRLLRHIERTGRYEPLVARPHPEQSDAFQLLNGHHRAEALRRLGHATAEVIVWEVDDEEAAILLLTLNRLGGRDVLDKKLALLRQLSQRRQPRDLSKLIPQTQQQIERLLAAKRLPRPTPQPAAPFATAIAFFLNETQRPIVEQALSLAMEQTDAESQAARRAAALTRMAQTFISHEAREPG